MTTFDAKAYINTKSWQTIKPGLERTTELLARLGNPHQYLRFIHVAGTNGKGSTCAYLSHILQVAGYKTGLFTSPSILRFEDRIRINGEDISETALTQITLKVKDAAESMVADGMEHPSEYELLTAVAFLYFFQERCDVVVAEVGLGGLLDATNIIESPLLSIITSIDYDHMGLLGNTLTEIAEEKAGIIKPGRPVVSYPQKPEAMEVIQKHCQEKHCPLIIPDFSELTIEPFRQNSNELLNNKHSEVHRKITTSCISPKEHNSANRFNKQGLSEQLNSSSHSCCSLNSISAYANKTLLRSFIYHSHHYQTALLGSYQPYNATLALEAASYLNTLGFNLSSQAIEKGILQTSWPGRFEIIHTNPLFIIDGSHNPQGARALSQSLTSLIGAQSCIFILGVLKDKDYLPIIEALLPHAFSFICVEPPNPRALSKEELAASISAEAQKQNSSALISTASTVKEALSQAFSQSNTPCKKNVSDLGAFSEPIGASKIPLPICACGSLYSIPLLRSALDTLISS